MMRELALRLLSDRHGMAERAFDLLLVLLDPKDALRLETLIDRCNGRYYLNGYSVKLFKKRVNK